jgi:hypothetical protein
MSDPRYTGQCGILIKEEPEEKFRFRYKSGKTIFGFRLGEGDIQTRPCWSREILNT